MGKIYGYIRVSSKEQSEDRQLTAMLDFGVSYNNIFTDKQSGKDFNRPSYQKLLKKIKPDDVLVIKSIDRLGRNYNEILNQWRIIVKMRLVNIVVLDMPLLDTRHEKGDLTGVFISDMVLQILSYVAQTEREFIHKRQSEGIIAAKNRGIKFGRPYKKRPVNFEKIYAEWRSGQITMKEAVKRLKICKNTFKSWVREME